MAGLPRAWILLRHIYGQAVSRSRQPLMTMRTHWGDRIMVRMSALLIIALLLGTVAGLAQPQRTEAAGTAISGLRVSGNRILNGAGQPVRVLGVNRSGTEYACIQGWGFFDGPSDAASVKAIAAWRANAVRVPLNETCWLGINGAPSKYSGANYRRAIASYVKLLNQHGLIAILELHWSAAGTAKATGMQPMPNRDHTITFWKQVAQAYKGNTSVIFDVFNEPFPENNSDTEQAWKCWKNGYRDGVNHCPSLGYRAAGMQDLVSAVRSSGAGNPIMVGGVQYANSLSRWLAYKPFDPLNNLIAAWHVYDFNRCNNVECWDATAGPVAQKVPLVAGEIGQNGRATWFLEKIMTWLDGRKAGYLAWVWNTWGGEHDLISNYNGTPTSPYGYAFKKRLASLPDSVAPVARPPVSGVVANAQLGTSTVPVRLAWSATDDRSGITRYNLQQSVNGGAFANVALPTSTTASIFLPLQPRSTYQFQVRASDQSGNWSRFAQSPKFLVGMVQEINGAITY